jgi:PD-(D/E)XK endonuclease
MEHPKAIGDRSTLAVMLALQEIGYDVYLPFGENTRCDLIVDDGLSLKRVQCKSGRIREGAIIFKVCSSYAHHPNPKIRFRGYRGEVDAFAVYCRQTLGVYLVPIDEVATRFSAALRITPTRNNQQIGVRFASPYLVASVRIEPEPP